MKNISLALNGVLAVAVIILYFLHFNSGETTSETNETEKQEVVKDEPKQIDVEKIASEIGYINVDSLQKHYKLYTELIDKLKAREAKYEKELNAKSSALEKKFIEFQKAAPTMSQFEGQTKQKELLEEEQKLYKMRDDFAVKFQEEEGKLNKEFQKKVKDFIKEYNKDKGYSIIIGASQLGNVVLDYNEGIDLSTDIINGLNDLYDQENAPKKDKKEAE